jgi:hypothetical protein
VESNLRTQPKQFWKYISKFKNTYHTVTHIKSGDNFIMEPQLIVEAFADHFRSVFNSFSATQVCYIPVEMTSSNFLNILLFAILMLGGQFDALGQQSLLVQMISLVLLLKVARRYSSL